VSVSAPDLVDRYGAPSHRRRPLVLTGIALLAVTALAWVVWVSLFHGRPQVTSELVGFHAADQHAATARFTVVRRDPDVRASCLLRAIATDHSVVGELTVPVTSGAEVRTLSATVRTERKATTVELVGCTAPGQKQPR
jgi:hypothetical protein